MARRASWSTTARSRSRSLASPSATRPSWRSTSSPTASASPAWIFPSWVDPASQNRGVNQGQSGSYRGNVWLLFTAQALLMFILWVPIWVVFLQGKGLSLAEIGLLEAVAWVIAAAVEVPTGAIADRWGRKTSIALGAFAYSLAMFLILADALSPAFLLGYALWNSSFAFVSGADSALLYDSLKADGRASEAAKQSGRYAAIEQGSQGIAALLGAALATVDITLCFTICGVLGLVATALVLTVREPPQFSEQEERLGYWSNLRTAIGIAARHGVVRSLLLL